jgi:hypothetical protein
MKITFNQGFFGYFTPLTNNELDFNSGMRVCFEKGESVIGDGDSGFEDGHRVFDLNVTRGFHKGIIHGINRELIEIIP